MTAHPSRPIAHRAQRRRHGIALPAALAAALAALSAALPALAAQAAPWPPGAPGKVGRLNDTGITRCMTAAGGQRDCSEGPQDAGSGRDVRRPDDADGRVGFSFEKMAADGAALPADAASWSCVRDRVTGLVWEMKTDDGGLHDKDNKFTHFGDGSDADTSTFVAGVNAQALCGRSDWRLPSRGELMGIVDYSQHNPGPVVDARWFPFSDGYSFWTSTAQVGNPSGSWYVNFQDGYTAVLANSYAFGLARAVSGHGVAPKQRFHAIKGGSEVADAHTGLVWQRCTFGQAWDGSTCSGKPQRFRWGQALQQAEASAAESGLAWRVPNVKELASLADDARIDPSIDPQAFPGTPSELYWSSSPYSSFPLYAWTVYGFDGSATFQMTAGHYLLRLVRSER